MEQEERKSVISHSRCQELSDMDATEFSSLSKEITSQWAQHITSCKDCLKAYKFEVETLTFDP